MKKAGLLILIIVFSFSNCTYVQLGKVQARFNEASLCRVAVMDFVQNGNLGMEKLGGFAADKLAENLFIRKKIQVVDRMQMKRILEDMTLNPHRMSSEDVRKLGYELKVNYIITGKIEDLSLDPMTAMNDKKKLSVSCQILDTKDGSVYGVLSIIDDETADVKGLLIKMIESISEKVDLN